MPIKAAYIAPNGEHHMGIPARDIVDEEWERFSDDQRALVRQSPFYRMIEVPAEAGRAIERVGRAAPSPARAAEPAPEVAPRPASAAASKAEGTADGAK